MRLLPTRRMTFALVGMPVRRIVADYLIAVGETVSHIAGNDNIFSARIAHAATFTAGRALTYGAGTVRA